MKSHSEFKPSLMLLAERIYQHRVVKKFSPKQIAVQLSLSPEAYRNIERGITDPSFTTLLLIAKILEVKFTDLFEGL